MDLFLFYIGGSIVKLKRQGAIYDERDSHIERKASSIAFSISQIMIAAFALLTYNQEKIEINIGGLMMMLFFVIWILYGIVYLFVKIKN